MGSSKIRICKEQLDVNNSPVVLDYALADLFNIFIPSIHSPNSAEQIKSINVMYAVPLMIEFYTTQLLVRLSETCSLIK